MTTETKRICDIFCSYLFHYISENRVIFFCITDDVSIGTTIVDMPNYENALTETCLNVTDIL